MNARNEYIKYVSQIFLFPMLSLKESSEKSSLFLRVYC